MIVNVNDCRRKKTFNVLPEKQRDIWLESKKDIRNLECYIMTELCNYKLTKMNGVIFTLTVHKNK